MWNESFFSAPQLKRDSLGSTIPFVTKPVRPSPRSPLLIRWIRSATYRFSYKRTLCTIPVAIFAPDADEKAVCYPKIQAALRLVEQHDPRRFRQLQRYVRAIILGAHPIYSAQWFEEDRTCELGLAYVMASTTTPSRLAATIIHETTHARLFRLGIDYAEARRARVEAICYKAQVDFASRLPDGAKIVPELQRWLEPDPAYYASSSFREREFESLSKLGCPEWIIRAVRWVSRTRAA